MAEDGRHGGQAIDAPGVRESLRSYRRHAAAITLSGSVLLIGASIAATIVEDRAAALERMGNRVQGEILATTPASAHFGSGSIEVLFTYQGDRHTTVVHLTDSSPSYKTGQTVTVLVDPTNSQHISVTGETNQSQLTVLPMVFALAFGGMGLVIGVAALARAQRQQKRLRGGPWRQVTVRCHQVRATGSARTVLLIEEGGDEHVLALTNMITGRLARTQLPTTRNADVVGDTSRYVVIRAQGCNALSSARRPRTARARRRWTVALHQVQTQTFPHCDPLTPTL